MTRLIIVIAVLVCAFQGTAQNDTIILREIYPFVGKSKEEVQGKVLNWLAYKCDDWSQVIHIKKSGEQIGVYYLKLQYYSQCLKNKPDELSRITLKILVTENAVSVESITSSNYDVCIESKLELASLYKEIQTWISK